MVSREGEEAECHETDSNFSTPPRMGSMKLSSKDDPLQNRLSIELCQTLDRKGGEVHVDDFAPNINANNENNNELGIESAEKLSVKINISSDRIKDSWNKDGHSSVKESQIRVPPIPQTNEGKTRKKILYNLSTSFRQNSQFLI